LTVSTRKQDLAVSLMLINIILYSYARKIAFCNAATDRLHPKISTWAMLVCSASFKFFEFFSFKLLFFMFLNYFDMVMLKIKKIIIHF
jgi:hypothetical protein